MKTLLFALATLTAGVGSAHAGLFSPSVLPGAIIGGTAGAIIGNNSNGHHGPEGALIGAIAGGLIGGAIDNDRDGVRRYETTTVYTSCAPTVVYRAPAPRVVYVPAPRRTVVYVAPRREVIVRHDVRVDHREARRDDRHDRRDHRR